MNAVQPINNKAMVTTLLAALFRIAAYLGDISVLKYPPHYQPA